MAAATVVKSAGASAGAGAGARGGVVSRVVSNEKSDEKSRPSGLICVGGPVVGKVASYGKGETPVKSISSEGVTFLNFSLKPARKYDAASVVVPRSQSSTLEFSPPRQCVKLSLICDSGTIQVAGDAVLSDGSIHLFEQKVGLSDSLKFVAGDNLSVQSITLKNNTSEWQHISAVWLYDAAPPTVTPAPPAPPAQAPNEAAVLKTAPGATDLKLNVGVTVRVLGLPKQQLWVVAKFISPTAVGDHVLIVPENDDGNDPNPTRTYRRAQLLIAEKQIQPLPQNPQFWARVFKLSKPL